VSVGQQALVRFPKLPGEQYTGRVEYVSPFLGDDRQIEIRITLENPNQQLKPQMYAEVSLSSELSGDQLVVPRKAVINSGVRELVYVAASENTYEPRLIRTGAVGADDMVQVASGLQAGEKVVVSGQFLLDSESRLSEALGGHMHGEQSAPEADDHEAIHASSSDDPYDIHTCPMPEHFHVLNYGPGICPECGMDLVPTTETDNTDVYVCPMPSCGVAESEPGLCPVCNMHLMKYEPELSDEASHEMDEHEGHAHETHDVDNTDDQGGNDADPYDIHTCPMPEHFHVLNYGPGTCPECGMDLVPTTETDNTDVYVCPMPSCGVAESEPGLCPVCNMHLMKYESESGDDK
jgi:hypothetical protein